MKIAMCVTVAIVFALFATACNNGSDAPHVGKWDAVSITALGMTMDVKEAFTRETSLNLRSNGTCTVTINGESKSGVWSITDGIVGITVERQDLTGLIDYENGFFILSLPSRGMDVNFVHQDGKLIPQPPEPETVPMPGGWRSSDPKEWWQGEWYGLMMVTSVLDGGKPMRYTWDCFGESAVMADGEIYLSLWDEGIVIGRPTFTVDYQGGAGDRGRAVARGGAVLEISINSGDWISDPELSRYKDQFVFEVHSEAEGGVLLEYQIVLRPWGMLWDDVQEDERPPGYDRYLDL
jgi:hypothetical protein